MVHLFFMPNNKVTACGLPTSELPNGVKWTMMRERVNCSQCLEAGVPPRPHPATYSSQLIPVIASMVQGVQRLLDPYGGKGQKLPRIREHGFTGQIYMSEIEEKWARQAPEGIIVRVGDSRDMPWEDNFFDGAAFSPDYGNRFADKHAAMDGSKRHGYTHYMGEKLQPGNGAEHNWGKNYKGIHLAVMREIDRVVNGPVVLNMKDHYRKGVHQPVTQWWVESFQDLGFRVEEWVRVDVRGLGEGVNMDQKDSFESVVKLTKE